MDGLEGPCSLSSSEAAIHDRAEFDHVSGSHIPNRDGLSPKVIAYAITLGDVNVCSGGDGRPL